MVKRGKLEIAPPLLELNRLKTSRFFRDETVDWDLKQKENK